MSRSKKRYNLDVVYAIRDDTPYEQRYLLEYGVFTSEEKAWEFLHDRDKKGLYVGCTGIKNVVVEATQVK